MTSEEREQWWSKLIDSENWTDRDAAAEAILDRVEQLEKDLSADRASLLPLLDARDRALARVTELEAELVTARAAPPRPEFTWPLAERIVDAIWPIRDTHSRTGNIMAVSAILGEFARNFEPPKPAAIVILTEAPSKQRSHHGFADWEDAERFADKFEDVCDTACSLQTTNRWTWHPAPPAKEGKTDARSASV